MKFGFFDVCKINISIAWFTIPFIVNESRLEIFTDDPCDKFP